MLAVIKHRTFYRILKSETINSLRKQYDAFLEEDKKRKERNEYILGRLERMRYSTALVPVRDKPAPHISRIAVRYPEDIPQIHDLQIPINRHQTIQNNIPNIEDTHIIQEISKNYILIPKLRSSLANTYIRQNIPPIKERDQEINIQGLQENSFDASNTKLSAIDNNWQSKYEILNILKQEEKEKQSQENIPNCKPATHLENKVLISKEFDKGDCNYENMTPDINGDIGHKYLDELPEKEMPVKKEFSKINHDNKTNDFTTMQTPNIINNKDIKEANMVDMIDHELKIAHLEEGEPKASALELTSEIKNYQNLQGQETHHDEQLPVYDNHDISGNQYVNETHYEGQLHPDYDMPEMSDKQYVEEHHQTSNNITSEQELLSKQFTTINSTNELYVEELQTNPIEVGSHSELMVKTDSIDGLDSNSKLANVVDASAFQHNNESAHMAGIEDQDPSIERLSEVENTVVEKEHNDDSEIQAFDTEQREMFYMEHPAEAYNMQDDVNVNEQEYQQNEEGNQNQEYSYYDNMQPEAYPVDLDANEEETSRYDPTYQQQYVDSYEKSYKQQPQQYEVEQTDNPIQPEEFEQVYETEANETFEGIQSTLDTEEGYIEKQENEVLVEQSNEENLVEQSNEENLVEQSNEENLVEPTETENRPA